jgi:uncharacterized membrane protein
VHRLLIVSHLASIAVYLGATVFLGILIEVVGRGVTDAAARRGRWVEVFSVYNPLAIAALGVMVMTGAWALTPYKEALRKGYFEQVGNALASKLGLAFLVIMTGTWVTFGICHRLVRAHQFEDPVTDRDLERFRMRLRSALWLSCLLTLMTLWTALGMKAPALPG